MELQTETVGHAVLKIYCKKKKKRKKKWFKY